MIRPRRSRRLLALLAGLPLLVGAGLLAGQALSGSDGSPAIAFAQAGPGTYAVAIRNEGAHDTVLAVDAATGDAAEVAKIEHLEGYASFAAVSPDGNTLAAVVADQGTRAHPSATLHIVDLNSGEARALERGLDQLQQPLWDPAGADVYVTRTTPADSPAAEVQVLRVDVASGAVAVATSIAGVAGAYPVGFDAGGRLLTVAIAAEGSVLYRDSEPAFAFSPAITRDWRVSPDGTQLAFIEAAVDSGLEYRFGLVSLIDGSDQRAQRTGAGQQLGVAWNPADGTIAVGQDPGSGTSRNSSANGGFDVPLAYSPDGTFLAVEAWSGGSFERPGQAVLEIAGPSGRVSLASANRFAGWVVR